jgi:uncharacterized protein (DUF1778 family)
VAKTKDDVMKFRVNRAEKRAIERAAEKHGLSASAWVRTLALRAAGVLPKPVTVRGTK